MTATVALAIIGAWVVLASAGSVWLSKRVFSRASGLGQAAVRIADEAAGERISQRRLFDILKSERAHVIVTIETWQYLHRTLSVVADQAEDGRFYIEVHDLKLFWHL